MFSVSQKTKFDEEAMVMELHHKYLGSEMFQVMGATIWLIWMLCASGKMHSWARSAFGLTLICFIC